MSYNISRPTCKNIILSVFNDNHLITKSQLLFIIKSHIKCKNYFRIICITLHWMFTHSYLVKRIDFNTATTYIILFYYGGQINTDK